MNRPTRRKQRPPAAGCDGLVGGIGSLLGAARRTSARTVNALLTATCWEIGRRIVEFERGGKARAEYGEALLQRLAAGLTARFGRGFGAVNLSLMKRFHLLRPAQEVLQTPSGESPLARIAALAHYALDNLPNKVLAAELEETRRLLVRRGLQDPRP
ncbi:MAG: hypothetical protein HY812_15915 [Planctomycetes bacterium]|nr:hypothetical protein [Planctomycetota bacterium]